MLEINCQFLRFTPLNRHIRDEITWLHSPEWGEEIIILSTTFITLQEKGTNNINSIFRDKC